MNSYDVLRALSDDADAAVTMLREVGMDVSWTAEIVREELRRPDGEVVCLADALANIRHVRQHKPQVRAPLMRQMIIENIAGYDARELARRREARERDEAERIAQEERQRAEDVKFARHRDWVRQIEDQYGPVLERMGRDELVELYEDALDRMSDIQRPRYDTPEHRAEPLQCERLRSAMLKAYAAQSDSGLVTPAA